MALIPSHRHTRADLEHWRRCEAMDRLYAERCARRLDELEARAIAAIERFAADGPCYVGVSWGKDSVAVAHLARGLGLPMIWVRVDGVENPDCPAVRDAYLARHPSVYDEIRTASGAAEGKRTSALGFAEAGRRYGDRYLSGIRGEESTTRRMRVATMGLSTERTCAPIGRWTGADVFAYLYRHDLPVHPAYACTMGGMLDRVRVRVGALGGDRGTGRGRAEWERRYYPEAFRALARNRHVPVRDC